MFFITTHTPEDHINSNEMAAVAEFNSWLSSKLRASNADESIFGSYITGILEGDENNEEKTEALEGILGAIIVRVHAR